jgi:uncharacterized protein
MSCRRTCYYLMLAFLYLSIAQSPSGAQAPSPVHRDAEFGVSVETNVMVSMRDGVKLAADIYHPARDGKPAEGKFATLLLRTPYSKGDGKSSEATYYATRGYNVVLNDTRGRYASEGTWRHLIDDPQDGFDVVEWIATQPWSDGKIGTFGTSYAGGTQHGMAEMRPPHLTTMIPVDANSNVAIAGMRHGGAFELRWVNWIFNQGASNSKAALANPALKALLDEHAKRIREHVDSMPFRLGTNPLRVVPEYGNWLVEALSSGPEKDIWKKKGMSVVDHVADYADIPVLHITGWYDSWTRQVTMNYEALSMAKMSPQRLTIGPWTHGSQKSNVSGEVEFTSDAAIDFDGYRLRWFDHWLKGVENGVENDAPVTIYVMGTGDDSRSSRGMLQHGGSWRTEREWPLARTKPTPYYLHSDGSLAPTPPSEPESHTTYAFDPKHPVPTVGGNISSSANLMAFGGYDQRPREDTHAAENRLPLSERRDVLVFRTTPLDENVEVTGTVTVKLWVSSSCTDTDFTAKLIDEIPPNADYPLGFDLNLGDSIVRARYRESLDEPKLMKPGEVYPVTITLYPTSNVFKSGHRIRVDISSSNYPRFDVNSNTGDPLGTYRRMIVANNSVYHEAAHPSVVMLPIIPKAD